MFLLTWPNQYKLCKNRTTMQKIWYAFFPGCFWPLLNRVVSFEAAGALVKIGSSLKSSGQIKVCLSINLWYTDLLCWICLQVKRKREKKGGILWFDCVSSNSDHTLIRTWIGINTKAANSQLSKVLSGNLTLIYFCCTSCCSCCCRCCWFCLSIKLY